MNADTGEIREFMKGMMPQDGNWTELIQGQKVSFKGLFFKIAWIDVKEQRVCLTPISRKEYVDEQHADVSSLKDKILGEMKRSGDEGNVF